MTTSWRKICVVVAVVVIVVVAVVVVVVVIVFVVVVVVVLFVVARTGGAMKVNWLKNSHRLASKKQNYAFSFFSFLFQCLLVKTSSRELNIHVHTNDNLACE